MFHFLNKRVARIGLLSVLAIASIVFYACRPDATQVNPFAGGGTLLS
jgi:hypothetical protein